MRAGEFVADEVEDLMDQETLVQSACGEIVEYTASRHACLIFASGVQHGQHIVEVLQARTRHRVRLRLRRDADARARRHAAAASRPGELKYLCNVNVLTTGFDAPHIDCVALVRPTMSPGLYYQMVGRGFRLHPGKEDCLVLDFGGNVLRHGPVDEPSGHDDRSRRDGKAPAKECPECQALIATGYATCPQCGYVFPPPERQQHDARASEAAILSGQVTTTKYAVQDVRYSVHTKRGASDDAPEDAARRLPRRLAPVQVRVDLLRARRVRAAEGGGLVATSLARPGAGHGRAGRRDHRGRRVSDHARHHGRAVAGDPYEAHHRLRVRAAARGDPGGRFRHLQF